MIRTTESERLRRSELLLGEDVLGRMSTARVLIFGVGGVGSWCAECLVRTGFRHLTIVDADRVCVTNCNRQLMATANTVGDVKVEAMRRRLLEVNPDAEITAIEAFYHPEAADQFHLADYDFIIDCIDSLADKADLILRATGLPRTTHFYSSLGAALRTDPLQVRKSEFWSVKGDALARALRNRFKKQHTFPSRKFTCVYSEEVARSNRGEDAVSVTASAEEGARVVKANVNGSLCPVTATFGLVLASLVIADVEAMSAADVEAVSAADVDGK